MESKNEIVRNAILATNGILDYSKYQPRNKYDVLDDLDALADASDLKVIKPYAQKFGVMAEFQKKARELGVSV